MAKLGRGACCCEKLTEALDQLNETQFEGLSLTPLCDQDTGEFIGFFTIVRSETDSPELTTLYFDEAGNELGSAPANSGPCPECDGPTIDRTCYIDPSTAESLDWGTGEWNVVSDSYATYTLPNGVVYSVESTDTILRESPTDPDRIDMEGSGQLRITRSHGNICPDEQLFINFENLNSAGGGDVELTPTPDTNAGGLTRVTIYNDGSVVPQTILVDLTLVQVTQLHFPNTPINFCQIAELYVFHTCDPEIRSYRDVVTNEVVTDPRLVDCVNLTSCLNPLRTDICTFHWQESLCDRIDTVTALELFIIDEASNQVQKIDGLTGALLDSFNPPGGVQYANATVFDPDGEFYYAYDSNNDEWHRYDSNNLSAGFTNLGTFTGDPITGAGRQLTFGAYDPATGLSYVGYQTLNRYRVDFNAMTQTSLPAISGVVGSPSSLSITENGIHYVGSIGGGAGQPTRMYTIDPVSGVATFVSLVPDNITLNGADYDAGQNTGFYGSDISGESLYRWTLPDASDIAKVADVVPSGTLGVGLADVFSERVRFERVYHKNLTSGNVTHQDHTVRGLEYELQGVAEVCPTDFDKEIPVVKGDVRDLGEDETWDDSLLPDDNILTGVTVTVIENAPDNEITGHTGSITNVPTGVSMSWNADDGQLSSLSFYAGGPGSGGRMLINYTYRTG